MMQVESVEMSSSKEFLPSSWKPAFQEFVVKSLRRCVATQHKAVTGGSYSVNGWFVDTCQPVTLENVHDYMGVNVPDDQLRPKIHQNGVKTAFVAQLSNCDNYKRTHPIQAYYASQFKPYQVKNEQGETHIEPARFPNLHAHRDSDKHTHLNQTSLQDSAKRYTTNWRVSTYRNLWSRTKYWGET